MFIKGCVTSVGDSAAVHSFDCKKSADLNSFKLLLNLSERLYFKFMKVSFFQKTWVCDVRRESKEIERIKLLNVKLTRTY